MKNLLPRCKKLNILQVHFYRTPNALLLTYIWQHLEWSDTCPVHLWILWAVLLANDLDCTSPLICDETTWVSRIPTIKLSLFKHMSNTWRPPHLPNIVLQLFLGAEMALQTLCRPWLSGPSCSSPASRKLFDLVWSILQHFREWEKTWFMGISIWHFLIFQQCYYSYQHVVKDPQTHLCSFRCHWDRTLYQRVGFDGNDLCNAVGSVLEYHLKWIYPILVSNQQTMAAKSELQVNLYIRNFQASR